MLPWYEQVPGSRLYRVRALEKWIKNDAVGKQSEKWLFENWDAVIREVAPGVVVEDGYYRLNEEGKGRKFSILLSAGTGQLTDFSTVGDSGTYATVQGLIPGLCYALGNEVLRTISLIAENTKDFNLAVAPLIPIHEDEVPVFKVGKIEGIWEYRDYDGALLFRRFRLRIDDGEKQFRQLGETVGHWARTADGELERIEGGTRKKIRLIRGAFPFYNMDKLVSRKWARVIHVEGEKACDALNEWFQKADLKDHLAITAGAAGMLHSCDVDLLRHLVSEHSYVYHFWPDRDRAGITAVERFLKANTALSRHCVYWKSVLNLEKKDGWDAADIEDLAEFNQIWEKFLLESTQYRDPENSLEKIGEVEIPSHGLLLLDSQHQMFNVKNGAVLSRGAVDANFAHIVPRDKRGRLVEKPFDYIVNGGEGEVVKIWSLNGYDSSKPYLFYVEEKTPIGTMEKRLYCNRFTPLPHKEISLEEMSDYELDEKVSFFTDLMEMLIQNDLEARNYILDWLAFNIQYPGEKMYSSIILSGVQGTGKSTLGITIQKILGENCIIKKASEVAGKWNTFFNTTSLIVCEELRQSGEDGKRFANEIKNLITGENITTEMKHHDPRVMKNHTNLLFLTNYIDSIPIDDTENRYYFYHSEALPRTKNDPYFREYYENLEKNMDYLYTWFLRRDLSGFDPKQRAPHSIHKEIMLNESKDDWKAVIDSMLDNEEIPKDQPFHLAAMLKAFRDKHPRLYVSLNQVKKFLISKRGFIEAEHDGIGTKLIHETLARKLNQIPVSDEDSYEIIMSRVGMRTSIEAHVLDEIRREVNPGFNIQIFHRHLNKNGWRRVMKNGIRVFEKSEQE